jgi:hypothetical protein
MAVLSRQALYDRIWAEPVRTVAQELGLSDVGLKKICHKADIPVPERGYWAKLRAGQAVKPASLPPRGPGMPDAVYVGEHSRFGSYRSDPEAELADPLPVEPQFDEPIDQLRLQIAARVGKVNNERNLKSPHPLIRNLLADDEKRHLKPRDAPWRLTSAEPLFGSAFEKRRLRVLSSLFTALQKFGAQPWVDDAEARKIGVVVGVERVSFLLDHPSAKPNRDGQWQTRLGWADELRLTINGDGAQSWSDTEEHGLETHLTEMVVQLITAGELNYRASARASYERTLQRRRELEDELARRRAETARKAREAEIAAEEARRAQLLNMAADLRAADDIRALVARVLAQRGADDGEASRWGAWALEVAERLDPSRQLVFDSTDCVRKAETEEISADCSNNIGPPPTN